MYFFINFVKKYFNTFLYKIISLNISLLCKNVNVCPKDYHAFNYFRKQF